MISKCVILLSLLVAVAAESENSIQGCSSCLHSKCEANTASERCCTLGFKCKEKECVKDEGHNVTEAEEVVDACHLESGESCPDEKGNSTMTICCTCKEGLKCEGKVCKEDEVSFTKRIQEFFTNFWEELKTLFHKFGM